ncbi:hypothetical protein [Leptolyngbya iicbica]|uniref:Uncharacterized protein n=2 Tax=Cyanophyceae TaxID=3028117 RepID=A0A4Q7E1S1_9CYAN|nr:hypothetical protein [Leptolyngbya sp. LK]RZM74906.1 hypothetical protein DYY88_23005 [Leptolyngbya sp. LK]
MGLSKTICQGHPLLATSRAAMPPLLSRVSASCGDLAREYGFERHRRVYACPIDFQDNASPQPSFLEALLGDG